LKRDPYQREIEEAFKREWGVVHEENVEKKKARAVVTTVTVGVASNENIKKKKN